jgi:hypothetical protein
MTTPPGAYGFVRPDGDANVMPRGLFVLVALNEAEQAFDRAILVTSEVPSIRGEAYASRALVRASLGKWKLASEDLAIAEKREDVISDSMSLYNFGCTASLMSASVSLDKSVSDEARPQLVRDLKVRAIAYVKRAIEIGFFNTPENVKLFREDPDLDPIRSEPEFLKLVGDKK